MVKEFESTENAYLYIKGEMKRVKKDKDTVLATLSDKQAELGQYVSEHKTNFKNLEQVALLLNYYNSL